MAIRHDDLVKRAEDLAVGLWEREKAKGRKERRAEEGKNQLSKAIEVAEASGSIRVFENWLLYQASRSPDSGSAFWTQEVQSKGKKRTFAEALFEEVESLANEYQGDERAEALVWFLGYLRRAVVAGELLRKLRAHAT